MTVKSYLKLKSVRIHVYYCKFKEYVRFMPKSNKIAIVLGIFTEISLFAFFYQSQIYPVLESIELILDKSWLSLPLAISITWLISYYFHKKDKPIHEFWQIKRDDTISEIITYIKQVKANLICLEKDLQKNHVNNAILQLIFNNDLQSIVSIAHTNVQYLSNKEFRILGNLTKELSDYTKIFVSPNTSNSQVSLEKHIVNSEYNISQLIIDFKVSSKHDIDLLLKPISDIIKSKNLDQKRALNKMMIKLTLKI